MNERMKDVELILQRIAQSHDRFDARMIELQTAQMKTDAQMAKTDIQIGELRAAQMQTDIQISELRAAQLQTDAQLAKTDAQLAKTDAQVRKTTRTLSSVGINLGEITESIFFHALAETMEFGGIRYETISARTHLQRGNLQRDYDIVMINGGHVALIEIKHKLCIQDVIQLREEQLPDFRRLLPRYADHEIHLGMTSQDIPDNDALEYARDHGIGVLRPHGKSIEMVAPPLAAY